MDNYHIPVMPDEVFGFLKTSDAKIIVDCTLGGGGHTLNLKTKNPDVKIIAIDRDDEAISHAKNRLASLGGIDFIKGNFSDVKKLVKVGIDGILFDLGVSSYQIDEGGRGFSIRNDGPLDMRMDKTLHTSAYDVVNDYEEDDLVKIFFEYGEERFSRRVAKAITVNRGKEPIDTTFKLKEIIEKAIPTWKKRESVTRIFQAIRIEVNDELNSLKEGLSGAVSLLSSGGRIVVISYHSLEDRIVKRFFKEEAKNGILNIITKKPIESAESEGILNPRAKSAKLRCAEKI